MLTDIIIGGVLFLASMLFVLRSHLARRILVEVFRKPFTVSHIQLPLEISVGWSEEEKERAPSTEKGYVVISPYTASMAAEHTSGSVEAQAH